MTWKELGITKYPDYFKLPHWRKLNEKFILRNKNAMCWICTQKVRLYWNGERETSNLLLHHVSYDNLGKEILWRDIYILCHNCHTQVHFYLFGQFKTKLEKRDLLRRMYFLKGINCIQRKRFIPASLYLSFFVLV